MSRNPTITSIRSFPLRSQSRIIDAPIAAPMDRYAAFRHRRDLWFGLMDDVLVEVCSSDGRVGFGMTSGGLATHAIVEKHLASVLIGQDCSAIEQVWEMCYLASIPYGASGVASMARSAIDLALWDLRGKREGCPVFELLTTTACEPVPAYATGPSADLLAPAGLGGAKLSMQYGPWDGPEAVERNLDLVRSLRAELEPGTDIMVDAWMGWDLPFAERMVEGLVDEDVVWLEEPFPPDGMADLLAVMASTRRPKIATGEHLFELSEFSVHLSSGALDIIQPDIRWAGGITQGVRICEQASEVGVPVMPHLGGQVWSLHLIVARPECSSAEWYVEEAGTDDSAQPKFQVLAGSPSPRDGMLFPSSEAGFGVEVDWAAVERLIIKATP